MGTCLPAITKTFTLQMSFHGPSVLHLHTDVSNLIFQNVNKNVSVKRHMTVFRTFKAIYCSTFAASKTTSSAAVPSDESFSIQKDFTETADVFLEKE